MILKKEMRLCLASLALSLVLFLFPAPAKAEPDGSGEIDPYTGEYIDNGEEGSGPVLEDQVAVSGGVYSKEMDRFIYNAGKGKIYTNIANGMIVMEPVNIDVSEGTTVAVYRDGEELPHSSSYQISDQGEYSVTVLSQQNDMLVMQFTIVNPLTNLIFRYDMPEKFFVSKVVFNGEELNFNRSVALTTDDGHYIISYGCPAIAKYYTMELDIDHTTPTFSLKGVNKKNVARGPITVENVSEDASVKVYSNQEVAGDSDNFWAAPFWFLPQEPLRPVA